MGIHCCPVCNKEYKGIKWLINHLQKTGSKKIFIVDNNALATQGSLLKYINK